MSLSVELRLLIYEFALRLANDYDVGIKGSRAIFIGIDDFTKESSYQQWKGRGYRTTA